MEEDKSGAGNVLTVTMTSGVAIETKQVTATLTTVAMNATGTPLMAGAAGG